MQGLDHNYLQELAAVQSVRKPEPKKNGSHHDGAFLENHPYASGLFTLDFQEQQV